MKQRGLRCGNLRRLSARHPIVWTLTGGANQNGVHPAKSYAPKKLYAAQDVVLTTQNLPSMSTIRPGSLFENTTYHVYPPEEWIRLAIPAKDYEGIYRPCTFRIKRRM
ncbi:hypothetical protein AAMO2058_000933100 [Amorphochlora amoebiformis]